MTATTHQLSLVLMEVTTPESAKRPGRTNPLFDPDNMFAVSMIQSSGIGLFLTVPMCFAGWAAYRRRFYLPCMVISYYTLLMFPLGTLFGLYPILVLNQPLAKRLFDEEAERRRTERKKQVNA
jgi:hypothetical protein